jgi:hypothetical protein
MIVKFGMNDKVRISDTSSLSDEFKRIKNIETILFKIDGACGKRYKLKPLTESRFKKAFNNVWFTEDCLEIVRLNTIDFKMLKSVCVNWDDESRRTENYSNIECQITGEKCCLVKCPIVTF